MNLEARLRSEVDSAKSVLCLYRLSGRRELTKCINQINQSPRFILIPEIQHRYLVNKESRESRGQRNIIRSS
jgi:hypothetical protein